MAYCPNCTPKGVEIDADTEWERVDSEHIRVYYVCDHCGQRIDEDLSYIKRG